jgi:hypothetical protein
MHLGIHLNKNAQVSTDFVFLGIHIVYIKGTNSLQQTAAILEKPHQTRTKILTNTRIKSTIPNPNMGESRSDLAFYYEHHLPNQFESS